MKKLLCLLFVLSLFSPEIFAQLPNQNMYLVKNLNTRPQGGSYSAIWGYLAPDGREYAILGCYGGTQFVDVTDSANIVEVGWLPSTGNTWREMKVYSHYAYIVSEASNSGIQIVDLQYLPDSIRYVGRYFMPGHSTTHSISQEGPYLYLNGANASFGRGTVIVDITNPEVPVKRGGWNDLYVHDSRILNDTIWTANINNSRLTVIDAVNKDAPQFVTSWINLPNSGPHNCAITMDRSHILVTDEIGASPQLMKIWNIEDLSNITYVTNWQPTGITTSVVHNVEIYGNYALVAHYTAGVRLVDISNPAQPNEVAWYDTYPANNGGTYSGCWGVFMFPSGKMIASDRQTGLYVLKTTVNMFAPLNSFNLSNPTAGTNITTYPNSNIVYNFNWDTSSSTATYKWIFGYPPPTPPRHITLSSSNNSLSVTSGQLDQFLQGLGISQGQTIGGQWDVWAFRNNFPENDSLKSANGPRIIYFSRGVPQLTAFNLSLPQNNTTITTSVFNSSNVTFNWTRSGEGTSYKVKFGSPTINTPILNLEANGNGYDSVLTMVNSELDQILNGIGLQPGDSLIGQYAVWAYNQSDSLKSTETFNLTLKRQAKGNIIILYDSTSINGRTSRDSVINVLNQVTETYDLFNRGSQTSTSAISLRGYKKVILLGEATSVMNTRLKDSVIAYLNSGGTTPASKSKLLIFSEDIGYQFGRTGSTYYDANFISRLGWFFVADRPASGANQGLVGDVINTGLRDSTVGSWPDVFRRDNTHGSGFVLYKYRTQINNPDSAHAVGLYSIQYNVATFGADIRSLRNAINGAPGSPVQRLVTGGLDFIDGLIVLSDPVSNLSIPTAYSLSQNYPNPFNPSTKINYGIPKGGLVNIKIYDLLGKEVATLMNEEKQAGYYDLEFNASHLSSGVYFYRIRVNDFVATRRMMLIK